MARNTDLAELAESIFADSDDRAGSQDSAGSRTTDATGLDQAAWKACAESGLTTLTAPDTGGTLDDAAVLLEVAGARAARVPLAETDLLAGWLARRAGRSRRAAPAWPGRRPPPAARRRRPGCRRCPVR